MTNNHVLADETIAANSIVEFNYQENVKGELLPVVQFRLEPQTFFATSPAKELDFTIVAVAEKADDGTSLTSFGYKPLHAMEGEILAGESVTIIQHPNGEPKQIALRENLVLKFPEAGDRFLHYQTDTTPGSSGSPVYNDQWEVVALHHSGYPRRDAAGNILATDGRIWKKEMGEHRIDWIANEGIRIRAIVDYLKRIETLTADQVALRDAALAAHELSLAKPDLSQTPFSLSGGAGTATTQPAPASLGTTTGLPIALAGQANWIIPLQVSVSLGTPMTVSGMGVIPTPSGAPGRPSIGPQLPARPTLTHGLDRIDEQAIQEAKAELERSAKRSYLDEQAEAQAKRSYYQGIASNVDPREFFWAFGQLLESTHKNRPPYAPVRMLYPWVDLQPDRRIKSVYSGQEFDPLELIEMDLEVDRARAERLEAFRAMEVTPDPAILALEEAMLEASLPYNCEHTVPQSWFGKREPMRGDLHHLFACESGCNSFRGNTP